jgi:tRNA 2-thiouridine synthesizing protein A
MIASADGVYDLRGLKCPLPVLKTRRRLRSLETGEMLTIDTSDPLAAIDIPHFCNQEGHEVVAIEKTADGHRFVIRRGSRVSGG